MSRAAYNGAPSHYRFVTDGGHGWLEVPLESCEGLPVSPYSYWGMAATGRLAGRFVAYLEEDVDAPRWERLNGRALPLHHEYHDGDAFVRDLERFPSSAESGFMLELVLG